MLTVFIPKESEPRVAATPETVALMRKAGLQVVVQKAAGERAFFSDESYKKAGARIGKPGMARADIILAVQPPKKPHPGATVISFLPDSQTLKAYQKKRITFLSMNHIPRTSAAQKMDALSSQSNIAGYKAVILAASHLPKVFPLMMTAAGTLQPAKVLILGAGVAGLVAAATSKRLGAVVEVSDIRSAAREQVESLGASFIGVTEAGSEDSSGYAKEASADFAKRLEEEITKRLPNTDVVITTALVPGKKAPILLTEKQVKLMKPGSVIIDLAAEQAGNCSLTKPGRVIHANSVTIDGTLNLPGAVPRHASEMYAKNVFSLLEAIARDGKISIDRDDRIIEAVLVMHNGILEREVGSLNRKGDKGKADKAIKGGERRELRDQT